MAPSGAGPVVTETSAPGGGASNLTGEAASLLPDLGPPGEPSPLATRAAGALPSAPEADPPPPRDPAVAIQDAQDRPLPAARADVGATGSWSAAAILDGRVPPDVAALTAALADPARVAATLFGMPDEPARIERLIASTDEAGRRRLLDHLRPGFAARELVALELLWSALPDALRHADPSRTALWRFALRAAGGRLPPAGGITGLTGQAVATLASAALPAPALARAILDRLAPRDAGHPPAAAAQVATGLRRFLAPADTADTAPGDALVHSRTAGLVLLAPYLPTLFRRLDLLGRDGFHDAGAADRGLDVLAALVHGPALPRPDGRPLERLLCALPPDQPLRPPLPLAAAESAVVEDLLAAVIARWTALGATSRAGLREAFLAREGLIRRRDTGHRLEVMPRAFDLLLDRLPWSYALIKLPWMTGPIHVSWRK